MSGRPIKKGSTNVSSVLRIIDSSTGAPETGVTSATGGLAFNYRREGEAANAITAINDLSLLTDAHTDGGILHIGDGYYRVDFQDAAFASGAGEDGVLLTGTATNMIVIGTYHPLVDYDPVADLETVRSDVAAIEADTNELQGDWANGGRLDLIIDTVASDLVLIYSDTAAIHSDTTIIASDVVLIYSDTAAIASDVVVIDAAVSDVESSLVIVKSDTAAIHSDTTIIASDVVVLDNAISDVESSLVIVKSDTTAIHSDTTIIASDIVVIDNAVSDVESSLVIVKSDLVQIYSDTTAIHSDTTIVASDVVVIDAAVSDVESSLVIVKSDLVLIDQDGSDIKSDLVIITSDTTAIHSQTTVIEVGAATIVTGAAEAGTLSTTQMTSDLAETTDDHYIGRIVIWTSGALANQASDITDYQGSNGMLTFTAVTEAPSAGNTFIIV